MGNIGRCITAVGFAIHTSLPNEYESRKNVINFTSPRLSMVKAIISVAHYLLKHFGNSRCELRRISTFIGFMFKVRGDDKVNNS